MMRPNLATPIAVVALVVACSGTSYAAAKIGTKQIKNNAITSAKIKNGAVKSKDIAAGVIPTVPPAPPTYGQTYRASAGSVLSPIVPAPADFTVLTLPNLPAGSYSIASRFGYVNMSAGILTQSCYLIAGPGGAIIDIVAPTAAPGGGSEFTGHLGTYTSAQPFTVTFTCSGAVPIQAGNTTIVSPTLVATRVPSVTTVP